MTQETHVTTLRFQKILSLAVLVVGAAFTGWVLSPTIGIDDANITQVYAGHLAEGHGYVYNIKGERVEGSTSLLWTLLNVIPFIFSDDPEMVIGFACAAVAFMIIYMSMSFSGFLSRKLGLNERPTLIFVAVIYLLFPSFFAWLVWSLMDVTIWALAVFFVYSRFVYILDSAGKDCYAGIFFVAVLAILPAIRPEGIAVALGVGLFLLVCSMLEREKAVLRYAVFSLVSVLIVFFFITAFRVLYFGYPLPNTFYAKVSTGYYAQLLDGLKYSFGFLLESNVSLCFFVYTVSISWTFVALRRLSSVNNRDDYMLLLSVLMVMGFFLIYSVLGGDHFASFRQYQVLLPLVIPFVAVFCSSLFSRMFGEAKQSAVLGFSVAVAIFSLTYVPLYAKYWKTEGEGFANEFRLAEKYREVGVKLNELGGQREFSVAVIPAGGLARTYRGHIYDLMGLNWVEMAHAVDDMSGGYKNHSSFDKKVFYDVSPDILLVQDLSCSKKIKGYFSDDFLKGLTRDEWFEKMYTRVCYDDLGFYILRSAADQLGEKLSPI